MINITLLSRYISFFSIVFFLSSCGGGSGKSGASENPSGTDESTGLPRDLNGLIVLDSWDYYGYGGSPQGIFAFELENGQLKMHKRLTSSDQGVSPYAQDRQTITYAQPCNGSRNFHLTKTINIKGVSSDTIISCSSKILTDYSYYAFGRYIVAKLSPNKNYIAVEIRTHDTVDTRIEKIIIKVFNSQTKEELGSFENYSSPEWLPGGRLLIATSKQNTKNGIYITNNSFTRLTRIDQGHINQNATFLDFSPVNNKLIFTMSGNIWMMDINQNNELVNLQEVANEGNTLETPSWSPDGKYIAYLSFSKTIAYRRITFLHLASRTPYVFETAKIFPADTNDIDWMTPGSSLSWVK